jgi:hypothetical protein
LTIFELHLSVNQRLQEVASYKRDKLFPQEIDLALNKAMFRFLEKGVDENFQGNQINLGDIMGLIRKNKINEVITPSISDPLYEDNILNVYSTIPPDLYWLIDSRAEVISDPLNCDTAPTLGTQIITEYVCPVAFPSGGSNPYFASLIINGTIIPNLYSAPNPINTGFTSSNSAYILINNIVESFYRHPTIKVYWERYRDVYYKNCLIFVSPSNTGNITISGTGFTSSTGTVVATNYTVYNRALISNLASKDVKVSPIKSTKENLLYSSLKQNQFYKTRKIEPLMDQTLDYFTIYREESFLVTRMYYDYIRKPRTISLTLNQSCELADSTHPKIVDMAVEILRLDTKDATYPATTQDINQRTN